jgi:hypothetical protein
MAGRIHHMQVLQAEFLIWTQNPTERGKNTALRELALAEVAFQGGDELAAKDTAEHLNGKEEKVAWLNVGVIER